MNLLRKELFSNVLISVVVSLATSSISAQTGTERTRVDTDLVLVDVLVLDRTGQPVKGIDANNFELFVDNRKRSIDTFSSAEAPVSFGIIYDMHPTTFEKDRVVLESLKAFKAKLPHNDDVFLAAFNMRGLQVFDFIPTVDQLERHMGDPATRKVRSLYDAVDFASDRIQASRHQKRILLVISDSADHQSQHSFSEIRAKLMTFRTEVYAVIVEPNNRVGYIDLTHRGQPMYPPPSDASLLDRAALSDLATKTGGATFFGDSESAHRLSDIYQRIAVEMRSHYTLGFYPDTVDRLRHQIRIKLRDVAGGKDWVITHRMSYEIPARNP